MSDPQRSAIVEVGLDPEEVIHLVERANAALGAPPVMRVVRETKNSEFGFWAGKSWSASKILKTITKGIQEETGLSEPEAINLACNELENIIDISEAQGHEAAQKHINYRGDPDYVNSKIYEWNSSGKPKYLKPEFAEWQVQTIIGTAIKHTQEKALQVHKQHEMDQRMELRRKELSIKQKAFDQKMGAMRDDFMSQAKLVELKGKLASVSVAMDRKKIEAAAAVNKQKDINQKLERAVTRHAKHIQNKSHQTKFQNFWESEAGKKRRDEVIRQGSVMSLAARRAKGMTKSEIPTQLDVKAAKSSFEKMLKDGKTGRLDGIKAIHDARVYGVLNDTRKRNPGKSWDEIRELGKPIPSIKRTYQEATGISITAKQAQEILLKEGNKDLQSLISQKDLDMAKKAQEIAVSSSVERAANDETNLEENQHLVSDSEKEKAKKVQSEAFQEAVFKPADGVDKSLITSNDHTKLSKARDLLDNFTYVKTVDPLTKDAEDQKLPEKQVVDKALDRAEKRAQSDRRFEDQLGNERVRSMTEDKERKNRPLDEESRKAQEALEKQNKEAQKRRERMERLQKQIDDRKNDPGNERK